MEQLTNQTHPRLYRSRSDVMLGGVCSGLARYLDVDTVLVRLLAVVLALSGFGVALYVILWVLIPSEPAGEATTAGAGSGAEEIAERARSLATEVRGRAGSSDRRMGVIIGAVILGWGVIALLRELHLPWLWWFDWSVIAPALLILAGASLSRANIEAAHSARVEGFE